MYCPAVETERLPHVLQPEFSFFYGAIAFYLSKLFAVYVLCHCAYYGALLNNSNAAGLQHHLRVLVMYSLGLLCDSLFGIPSRYSSL